MKYLRLALVVVASAASLVRAQDEERHAPPVEIPDFSNLDEYIYEPKSVVKLGFRHLSGPKAKFQGTALGSIPNPEDYDPTKTSALDYKVYHDGSVSPDARTTPVVDSSGNAITDPQTGVTLSVPMPADGRTNTWSSTDDRQADSDHTINGYISFHSYSASVTDREIRNGNSRSTSGLDLTVTRNVGNLYGTKVTWSLVGGISVNDISAKKVDRVHADVQTIADLYSLYGQVAPTAPYSAPSSSSSQTVTNSDGSTTTISSDSTVLISSTPAGSQTTHDTTGASNYNYVYNNWKIKGSYFTFRGGPEVSIAFTSKLHVDFSCGPVLVYSGSNYTVSQTLVPEIGADITLVETSSANKLLPGYYADATLQYDLTDKSGFFAGAVFQSAAGYTQHVDNDYIHYQAKIDLANQSGVRAGMSIRF